ncbi:hypothetical protein Snoj_13690 [Streptomyces nojiriensis]|uniref:Uncharacterized protein n=1 Tax=Streptomyces nojiriensis TaxID=66374 RepID=A0ABQ3SH54_9ACTN|nr:hypothetical protein JYK04_06953 [Streptomyces nojiriensis]GGS09308.1 hypothetical protein GCM10010205_43510 [Streptomyces nojiriensis]GHI67451.1 hypothetical protein Snoj_13690 [Streptomyces nojiriensis]
MTVPASVRDFADTAYGVSVGAVAGGSARMPVMTTVMRQNAMTVSAQRKAM